MAQLLLVVQFSNQKKMKTVDYRFRFSERIEILQNILFFLIGYEDKLHLYYIDYVCD